MIKDRFKEGKPVFSIEIFPPKRTADIETIYSALDGFKKLNPAFISVTYGAGGTTSGSTAAIATYIQNKCGIETLSHLTCASLQNEQSLEDFIITLQVGGIDNVLALRGDLPRGMSQADFDNRYYEYASDLARALSNRGGLCIAGACYPEKHQEATSFSEDISNLKVKIENGVDFLISQLFYDNEAFFRFMDMARSAGIAAPITAGLMPITAISQVENIVGLSGCALPKELTDMIEQYKNSPEDLKQAGLEYTKKQMDELLAHGVDGIHLYSMNKVEVAETIFG